MVHISNPIIAHQFDERVFDFGARVEGEMNVAERKARLSLIEDAKAKAKERIAQEKILNARRGALRRALYDEQEGKTKVRIGAKLMALGAFAQPSGRVESQVNDER